MLSYTYPGAWYVCVSFCLCSRLFLCFTIISLVFAAAAAEKECDYYDCGVLCGFYSDWLSILFFVVPARLRRRLFEVFITLLDIAS